MEGALECYFRFLGGPKIKNDYVHDVEKERAHDLARGGWRGALECFFRWIFEVDFGMLF